MGRDGPVCQAALQQAGLEEARRRTRRPAPNNGHVTRHLCCSSDLVGAPEEEERNFQGAQGPSLCPSS
jgi:hypothetical protein